MPLYYLFGLWAPRLVLPFRTIAGRLTWTLALDSLLVVGFLTAQIGVVVAVGQGFGKAPGESLLLGVLLPFLVWNAFISFVIFLHHTHPAVEWYPSVAAWMAARGALRGAVHVRFPWPIGAILLFIMEHNAHHHAPAVPLYNLARMQREIGDRIDFVAWRFSWRGYARICRRCKLYDYDARRWVGFDSALPVGAGDP